MSTLSELLAEHTDLPGVAVDHLQRVVGDWQLLADLSFADLLLWVGAGPITDGADIVCVAQCRPTTAATVHLEDMVGSTAMNGDHVQVFDALRTGTVVRSDSDVEAEGVYHPHPVHAVREAIPVRCGDDVIAVLSRDTDMQRSRVRSTLEIAYLACADDLCQMIADGSFHHRGSRGHPFQSTRR